MRDPWGQISDHTRVLLDHLDRQLDAAERELLWMRGSMRWPWPVWPGPQPGVRPYDWAVDG